MAFAALGSVDGCVSCCTQGCLSTPTPTPEFDDQGRRVFSVASGLFLLVIEGGVGASNVLPGPSLAPGLGGRPDLQIESDRPLGNGSVQVCDTGSVSSGGGGVPAIVPPSFGDSVPMVTNALLDFSCRFDAQTSATNPCTITDLTREPRLINSASRVQFCSFLSATEALPPGESVLSVVLRDQQGNLGPMHQIVVRVATPHPATATPTPTATSTPTPTRTPTPTPAG